MYDDTQRNPNPLIHFYISTYHLIVETQEIMTPFSIMALLCLYLSSCLQHLKGQVHSQHFDNTLERIITEN